MGKATVGLSLQVIWQLMAGETPLSSTGPSCLVGGGRLMRVELSPEAEAAMAGEAPLPSTGRSCLVGGGRYIIGVTIQKVNFERP